MKIDQQSQSEACQAEVREDLGLMDFSQFLDGLDLDQQSFFDQEIHSVGRFDVQVTVAQWNGHLPAHANSFVHQLPCQAGLVGGFEQSRSQAAMHRNRCSNHPESQVVQ